MQKEGQVSFLAEKIRQADAVLIGGGSGLSSAAGYNHYHFNSLYGGMFTRFQGVVCTYRTAIL